MEPNSENAMMTMVFAVTNLIGHLIKTNVITADYGCAVVVGASENLGNPHRSRPAEDSAVLARLCAGLSEAGLTRSVTPGIEGCLVSRERVAPSRAEGFI